MIDNRLSLNDAWLHEQVWFDCINVGAHVTCSKYLQIIEFPLFELRHRISRKVAFIKWTISIFEINSVFSFVLIASEKVMRFYDEQTKQKQIKTNWNENERQSVWMGEARECRRQLPKSFCTFTVSTNFPQHSMWAKIWFLGCHIWKMTRFFLLLYLCAKQWNCQHAKIHQIHQSFNLWIQFDIWLFTSNAVLPVVSHSVVIFICDLPKTHKHVWSLH